jgi:hypothetical protein
MPASSPDEFEESEESELALVRSHEEFDDDDADFELDDGS